MPWRRIGELHNSWPGLQMELRGQLHAPRGESPVPTGYEAGWAPEPFWTLWRSADCYPYRVSNPGRPAHTPSLYRLHNYLLIVNYLSYIYALLLLLLLLLGARVSVVGSGTMLQAGRSRDRFPMRWIFFCLRNTSSRTMALGSTQPLTEMSTRNLSGGKGRPARKADNLTANCEPTV
jgi:hypothetical protein